jgi:hypothetical protein
MRRVAIVAIVLVGVATARAAPSIDELAKSVHVLRGQLAKDAKAATGLVAAPFTFAGETGEKTCAKWTRAAVAASDLPAFLPCLASSAEYFLGAFTPSEPPLTLDWKVVDLKKLPKPFAKHKAKLGKLAGDHLLAIVQFDAPVTNYLLVAVALRDGKVVFDGWWTGSQ